MECSCEMGLIVQQINAALWDPEEREALWGSLCVEAGIDRADEVMRILAELPQHVGGW